MVCIFDFIIVGMFIVLIVIKNRSWDLWFLSFSCSASAISIRFEKSDGAPIKTIKIDLSCDVVDGVGGARLVRCMEWVRIYYTSTITNSQESISNELSRLFRLTMVAHLNNNCDDTDYSFVLQYSISYWILRIIMTMRANRANTLINSGSLPSHYLRVFPTESLQINSCQQSYLVP